MQVWPDLYDSISAGGLNSQPEVHLSQTVSDVSYSYKKGHTYAGVSNLLVSWVTLDEELS